MKEIIKLPVEHYLQLIKNNKPFSFSRFGDGEALCINNPDFFKTQKTYPYRSWILTCGDQLLKILINNHDYYHCFLYGTFWERGPHRGNDFIKILDEKCGNMNFYDGEVWQDLSFDDGILKITKAIDPYIPVFIGGKHLKNIEHINGISKMKLIEIDDVNAYEDYDFIYNEIMNKFNEGSRMFCFSASIVGKILIDNLFPIIGDKAFMIDFGSLFDPYCGKLSRSNMITVGFEKFQPHTKIKLL